MSKPARCSPPWNLACSIFTHRSITTLSPAQLESAGVPEDLVRISIGLEDIEDILWDLDQALTEAQSATADDAVVLEEPADTCTIGAN